MKTIIAIITIVLSLSLEAQIYINNSSKSTKTISEKNDDGESEKSTNQLNDQTIDNVKPTTSLESDNKGPVTYIRKKTKPIYKTIYEIILHSPETSKEINAAPEYNQIEEKVMVSPKIKKWVKGEVKEDCKSPNPEDCQVLTLIEIPASYKTIKKEVLVNEGETKTVVSPKTYKVVKKEILVTPETYVDVQL